MLLYLALLQAPVQAISVARSPSGFFCDFEVTIGADRKAVPFAKRKPLALLIADTPEAVEEPAAVKVFNPESLLGGQTITNFLRRGQNGNAYTLQTTAPAHASRKMLMLDWKPRGNVKAYEAILGDAKAGPRNLMAGYCLALASPDASDFFDDFRRSGGWPK